MKRVVLLVVATLACPAVAMGAVFTSQPYGGQTFASGTGPFSWTFVSSEPPGTEFGDVGYRLRSTQDSDQEWYGCLQGPHEVSLSDLPPGEYAITIADDYSEGWLLSDGLGRALCSSPAGGNFATDSFMVGGVPTPENKGITYVSPEPEPWVREAVGRSAAEQLARAEAERKAREARDQAEREAQEAPLKLALAKKEHEAAESKLRAVKCVVPSLSGDSVGVARKALLKAHCKLSRVTGPHGRHGALMVVWQSVKREKKLSAGAGVAVRLGSIERS